MLLFERGSAPHVPSHHDLQSAACESNDATRPIATSSPPIPQLVFLLGSPRSGTTYLAKLLDCAPSTGYLHEPLSKGRGLLVHRAIGITSHGHQLDTHFVHALTLDLVQHLPQYSKPPFFPKHFERIPWALASAWFFQRFFKINISYSRRLLDLKNLHMLVLKDGLAPFSHRLCRALQARMIVLLRHPCGVVNSMLRGEQIGAMGRGSDAGLWSTSSRLLCTFGYTADDLKNMQPDELHALRWLVANYPVLEWMDDPAVRVVTYSDLIQKPETTYTALCAWLGLPVAQRALRLMRHPTRAFSEWIRYLLGPRFRYYSIVPRGPELDRAWQHELPADSIARILRIAQPFPLDRFWPHFAQ
jgi:hypothetical protein